MTRDRVLHWCSWGPCSGLIDEDEPKVLTEDGFMHPRCANEALEVSS